MAEMAVANNYPATNANAPFPGATYPPPPTVFPPPSLATPAAAAFPPAAFPASSGFSPAAFPAADSPSAAATVSKKKTPPPPVAVGLSPCGISVVPPILQQPVGGGAMAEWTGGAWPTLDRRGVAGDTAGVWNAHMGKRSSPTPSLNRPPGAENRARRP